MDHHRCLFRKARVPKRVKVAQFAVAWGLYLISNSPSYAMDCKDEKLRVEAAESDTTLVCEEGGNSGSDDSAGVPSSNTGFGTPISGGHGGGGTGVHVGPQFVVQPKAIKFKQCPGNSQQSYCTAIRFVGGDPPAFVDVGVTVTAPGKTRDGKALSTLEAQLDSAQAATATAFYFIGKLQSGAANVTEVNAGFAKRMDTVIRNTGIGYRVQQCPPVKNPPEPKC